MATVRTELPKDARAIRVSNERAFGRSAEADIVDALRERCPDCLSLVATADDQIVGHILFTPVTIEQNGKGICGMGLAPMAVLPEYQRRGIGSRLVRAGIAMLQEASCPFVIVLGDPDYYPRFGFVPASTHGLLCQWEGVPADAFMALILDETSMTGVSGIARYRDEFDQAM